MRKTYPIIAISGLVLIIGSLEPASVRAAAPQLAPNQIRVTGIVPDRRMVVVDSSGTILQFFSNTAKPVQPEVMVGRLGGPVVPWSPVLEEQYGQLLRQLRTNKVVSVRAQPVAAPLSYPSFLGPVPRTQQFTVTPTRMAGDEAAAGYVVILR